MTSPSDYKSNLQEQFFETDFVRLRRWFPFLHLLRVPSIALDWRKIVLALMAVCCSTYLLNLTGATASLPVSKTFLLNSSVEQSHGEELLHPLLALRSSLASVFTISQQSESLQTQSLSYAILAFLLCYCVWSFFGVAIARLAGQEFAVGTRGGCLNSGREATAKMQSTLFLLIIACIVLGGLFLFNAAWGVLIAWIGNFYVGLTTGIIPVGIAFAIFVFLFGIAFGWSLMIAAIAVDQADGFDALSRGYNYAISQFTNYLFYGAILLALGFLAIEVVTIGVGVLTQLLTSSTSLFVSDEAARRSNFVLLESVSIWNIILNHLILAYGVSFFWSGTTAIYFLLRKAEDGTPLDEIVLANLNSNAEEGVPLVGFAERAETERKANAAAEKNTNENE